MGFSYCTQTGIYYISCSICTYIFLKLRAGEFDSQLPTGNTKNLAIGESAAFASIVKAVFDCTVDDLPGKWTDFLSCEVSKLVFICFF